MWEREQEARRYGGSRVWLLTATHRRENNKSRVRNICTQILLDAYQSEKLQWTLGVEDRTATLSLYCADNVGACSRTITGRMYGVLDMSAPIPGISAEQ